MLSALLFLLTAAFSGVAHNNGEAHVADVAQSMFEARITDGSGTINYFAPAAYTQANGTAYLEAVLAPKSTESKQVTCQAKGQSVKIGRGFEMGLWALATFISPQTAVASEIPDLVPVESVSDTSLAHRKERMAQPLTGRKLMTQNSSVRVYAGDDGRFTIGTTDGKSLLYGFGRDGATSHTHFKLGSTIYGTYTDGEDHPPAPEIVAGPVLIDSSIVISWNQDDVIITQTLTPVMLGTEGKIFIEYTFENTGSTAIDAGLLLFFDTMIAHNDYAPIATEYGYFSVEREFLAPVVPAFWQAYESSPFQTSDSLVGEGIIVGSGAVMPDRLVYGDYWHYKAVEWDYIFAGGPYSDSSILYRWDERTIMPGGIMYVSTYYGQGAISSSGGSLMLSLASPSELLPRDCFDFSPNPFNLNVIVANTSPDSARGVLASIELPEGFVLATGTETASITPSVLAPGASGTISWSIRAEEDLSDSVYRLSVSATAPGLETFSASRHITITTGDRTPPTIELSYPAVDNTISSDAIDACFVFSDESGIAPGSFRIRAGTGTYTLMDSGILSMSHDSIYIHIPFSLTGITDGPFSVDIFDLADVYGCRLPRTSFDFIRDSNPPVLELLSPEAGDTIYGSPYTIRCSIEDEYSPVLIDSLNITINSSIHLDLASSGVSFDGRNLRILSSAFEGTLPEEYPLSVCFDGLMDAPDAGPGNIIEEHCFEFYFNGSHPACSLLTPDTEPYYSCDRIAGEISAYHPTGIDTSSISIFLDGELFGGVERSEIDFADGIISFDIPAVSDDSVVVGVTMSSMSGSDVPLTSWTFLIDRTAPSVELLTDEVTSPDQTFRALISDIASGIDLPTIEISSTVAGISTVHSVSWAGDTAIFHLADILGCETLTIDIAISDQSIGCGPNMGFETFSIETPCNRPELLGILVPEGFRCDPEPEIRYLFDSDDLSGDDLLLTVGTSTFDIHSPSVTFTPPELRFSIPLGILADGENAIVLSGVTNEFMVAMMADTCEILSDNTSPVILSISPIPLDTLLSRFADVYIEAFDEYSGLNLDRCYITCDGSPASFDVIGSRLTFSLEAFDIVHDTDVEVCIHLADSAWGCGGNSIDTCFTYHTDFSAPYAELVNPMLDEFYGCSDSIVIDIFADVPVDETSIVVNIGGVEYTTTSTELSFDGSRINIFGTDPDDDGTLPVTLDLSDIYGNSSSFGWDLFFDFQSPAIEVLTDTTSMGNFLQPLRLLITDNHSGIMWSSLILRINGVPFLTTSDAVTISGDTLIYQPLESYLEHNILSLVVSDNTEYCRNSTNISFTFDIVRHVPVTAVLYPSTDLVTGCDSVRCAFIVNENEYFNLDSLSFSLDVGEYEQQGDTIFFSVATADLAYGLNVITVTDIRDIYGYVFPYEIHLSFFYDNIAPELVFDVPEQLVDSASIELIFEDESGIDGIDIEVSAGWSEQIIEESRIAVNFFEPLGDSLIISYTVTDDIDSCINVLTGRICIPLEHPDFYATIIEPLPDTRTHVRDQRVVIRASSRHPDNHHMTVNGETIDGIEPVDDMFIFQPDDGYWNEGLNTVYFNLEGQNLAWAFTADYTPPSVGNVTPEIQLQTRDEEFTLAVSDNIAGVDFDAIFLLLDGVPVTFDHTDDQIFFDMSPCLAGKNPGDTIEVILENLSDMSPDYGLSNVLDSLIKWNFVFVGKGWYVEGSEIITPNGDDINDYIEISLPLAADVEIYDKKSRPVSSFSGSGKYRFDGTDSFGNLLPPGIYIYIIKQNNTYVRKGTVVIAR